MDTASAAPDSRVDLEPVPRRWGLEMRGGSLKTSKRTPLEEDSLSIGLHRGSEGHVPTGSKAEGLLMLANARVPPLHSFPALVWLALRRSIIRGAATASEDEIPGLDRAGSD